MGSHKYVLNVTITPMKDLLLVIIGYMSIQDAGCNLRCYSCAPCTEWDYTSRWTYPGRWEMDCPFDRYCMKISGVVQDAFGYGNQVSVRGCPWISLLTRLEEGCTSNIKSLSSASFLQSCEQ